MTAKRRSLAWISPLVALPPLMVPVLFAPTAFERLRFLLVAVAIVLLAYCAVAAAQAVRNARR